MTNVVCRARAYGRPNRAKRRFMTNSRSPKLGSISEVRRDLHEDVGGRKEISKESDRRWHTDCNCSFGYNLPFGQSKQSLVGVIVRKIQLEWQLAIPSTLSPQQRRETTRSHTNGRRKRNRCIAIYEGKGVNFDVPVAKVHN